MMHLHYYHILSKLLFFSPCRTVLFTLTSVVVLVITTDWISWDKLNRGFLPSDEVSRAFLASFILVFDLLIVMQVHSPDVSFKLLRLLSHSISTRANVV